MEYAVWWCLSFGTFRTWTLEYAVVLSSALVHVIGGVSVDTCHGIFNLEHLEVGLFEEFGHWNTGNRDLVFGTDATFSLIKPELSCLSGAGYWNNLRH